MHRHRHRTHHAALLTLLALAAALSAQGTPIGFAETYALAADRGKVADTLIPGTEDWYYYHCRERLDARDFGTVRKLLGIWIQRHGHTQRVYEIENREALLSFSDNQERTYDFLRQRLGLQWNHQRIVPGAQSDLPTRLDPELLSNTALTMRALRRYPGTVDGFQDRALAALASTSLDADTLRSLLTRLKRPDVDNLPALIVRDLDHPQSGGFGSLAIHRELRRAQLEECARLRPALLQAPAFVNAYLLRLAPSADTQWQTDLQARGAQLARLWAFAQRLSPAHNSLKAHVLFHWLQHDLSQGAPDKERFVAYIRLPRRSGHPSEAHLLKYGRADEHVNAGSQFPTGLPAIGDDEQLVRSCLEHFFAREDGYEAYAEFLDADWLRGVLAETKILLGQGDMERWYSLLNDPARLDQIEKRVEITFPPTLRTQYAAGDAVQLLVDTKNVPTLLVKVFAIDSYRYHVERQRPVDATIELDGIVANVEQTHTYSDVPLRRVRRTFDLPMLREPGTYVVEFVGNGISSRAVIHKGSLRLVERSAAAGQVVRVYDEAGVFQKDASAWFGGREYTADEQGEILVPFSTEPGARKIVLRQGNRSTLETFSHRAESYQLHGSMHVDREALIAGQKARLLVRTQLRLDDHDVSLQLLTEPVLTLVATDIDGLSTAQEVRGITLVDERELVHEISVPERLVSLQATLRGKVRDLAGKDVELRTATATFAVNGQDLTPETGSATLVRAAGGYAIELRGKDGEPQVGRTCHLQLLHRDYRDGIEVSLQSDAQGRIELGPLPQVGAVHMHRDGGFAGSFALRGAVCRTPAVLHGSVGTTLRVPYQGKAKAATRAEFSLLGSERDEFEHLAVADGFVELRDLPAGDYELRLHDTNTRIDVRVTQGDADGNWLVGRDRLLEASPTRPLQLKGIELAGGDLVVHLANHSKTTRVHVVATRRQPAFDPFLYLRGATEEMLLAFETERTESSYHAGRKLGDEYRYVLERRFATKYPGNMLHRPSLLLNPWALDDTSLNQAVGLGGGGGGRYGGRAGGRRGPGGQPGPAAGVHLADSDPGTHANLDYLPGSTTTLANLTPDENGVLRVKTADLGDGQIVHVLALDGDQAIYDTMVRPEQPLQPRVRHLKAALDGTQHFVEQKRIEFVAAAGQAVLDDARSARVEVYDSLASVFSLLTTVNRDASLEQFAFVLGWPKLSQAQKQELYSKHACHELHFFLFRKDPEFFAAVVKPFLANKADKTFLDQWLLGMPLQGWLEPWSFAQLNLIEKILLAQRLAGENKHSIARSLREALELRPVDRERIERLFDLALKSKELDTDKGAIIAGLEVAAEKAPAPATDPEAQNKPAAAPAAPEAPEASEERARKALAEGKDEEKVRADDERREQERDVQLVDELSKRGEARRLFRAVEPTRLLVEHNYWHRRIEQTTPDVVAPNRFWIDFATATPDQPFVSSAIVEAGGSFLEAMMALSVLDLPFEAGKHEITANGDQRTLRAATPLLLVRKEVSKTEKAPDQAPLLLGENFFRLDDRYRFENGERRDAFVTDEFLADVAYGCQVVVTNPTSTKRTTEVLLQVPAGAIPVQKGFWTRGVAVELQPYATATIEYAFYFPATGDFAHYPAHAAEKGKLAANAEPRTLHVVATASKVDTTSWEHVSQQGTPAEVLAHIDGANVQRLELAKVAWRMKDREFFGALLPRLRARHVYDHTLWSYGIMHRDADAAREYLRHAADFLRGCGAWLRSPLVTIDPVERKEFQLLELDPLVHPRAHRLGSQRVIGNSHLAAQYGALMNLLGYHERLDSADWMAVTYYLLLQDRIEEALASFNRIDASKVGTQVQYDYLSAYLCFFTGDVQKARDTAQRYADYAVPHWQKRFADIRAQLDEAEGRAGPAASEITQDSLAATAPALELAIDGKNVLMSYRNLAQCEVRYYELDVEFAFSAQPFADANGTTAAFVQPNLREARDLDKTKTELAFELPQQFHQKNVLVEVRGAGIVRSRQYFANALSVRFLESYGQVAVTEPGNNNPLSKTYVKVFARLQNGTVRFHKDGYTDLRGRFDYASLSDDPNAGASRYAVLVLSEQRGAVIREVNPPTK